MNIRKLVASLVAGGTVVALSLWAVSPTLAHGRGPGGPRGPLGVDEIFSRYDSNADGQLTPSEVSTETWGHVSKADANADGAVTRAELEAVAKTPSSGSVKPSGGSLCLKFAEILSFFDGNGDGQLTQDEVSAQVWARVSLADANVDGVVTEDELQDYVQDYLRPGSSFVGEIFSLFDSNADGTLTQDEVPTQLWTRISAADANADSAVTKDELSAGKGSTTSARKSKSRTTSASKNKSRSRQNSRRR